MTGIDVGCLLALVACVTLFVCLPFTVTAQTLDHQQLDISGALETNPASRGDVRGQNLWKLLTHSVGELRVSNLGIPKNFMSDKLDSFSKKYELEAFHLNSGVTGRKQRSSNITQKSANVTVSVSPCPDPTDIAPCVCSLTDANELMMDCSAVESIDQLGAVFRQEFPFKEFKEFRIENNYNIEFLPDVFNGVSFKFIYFNNVVNLAQITNYAFLDSRNVLENIQIFHSALNVNTFPFDTLYEYPKLTYLRISWSYINYLPPFNSTSLQTLAVFSGKISVLLAGKMLDLLFTDLLRNRVLLHIFVNEIDKICALWQFKKNYLKISKIKFSSFLK